MNADDILIALGYRPGIRPVSSNRSRALVIVSEQRTP
jgi:hypothetical protein